jgi:hypothetical protein
VSIKFWLVNNFVLGGSEYESVGCEDVNCFRISH